MTRQALQKRFGLIVDLPRYYGKTATEFGFHPLLGARLLLRSLAGGYWPSEAYRLGLLHPAREPAVRGVHVSKRSLVKVQKRLNPPAWENMLSDKGVFYRYCEQAGLPIPRLYGIYARGGRGWNLTNPAPQADEEWVRFFESDCPSPFVVKPALGRLGMGVIILTRAANGFVEAGSAPVGARELVSRLSGDREFDSHVVQERLSNHPALRPVAAGEGLTTSRIITLASAHREVRILNADLKIVMKDNPTSNLRMGITGNLAAKVSLEEGRLLNGVRLVLGEGFVEEDRHPETGVPFRDFQLPDWEAAKELVVRAARVFLPVRTVGWDVAFTPSGPALIEGNFFYDPPCSTHGAREVLKALAAGAGEGR